MTNTGIHRQRLSIDLLSEEHRQIKALAAIQGLSIREYILESIRKRIKQETEKEELLGLTIGLDKDPLLRELWNNEDDAKYDRL